MYKSFRVKNFRCFKDLQINDLGRVNLIAGKNNTGKTALMEAMYVLTRPSTTSVLFDLQATRGLKVPHSGTLSYFEQFFFDYESSAHIQLGGETGTNGNLEISVLQNDYENRDIFEVYRRRLIGDGIDATEAARRRDETDSCLLFSYTSDDPSYHLYHFHGRADSTSLHVDQLAQYIPVQGRPERDLVRRQFSKVQESGLGTLLNPLRFFDARLSDLRLSQPDDELLLCGRVNGNLIPLKLMGEGVNRTCHLLLSMISKPHSILFVDEIENGIHHSVQCKVWQAIGQLARELDVQVFATTHSLEMIRAAYEAFSDDDKLDEFRFHRLSRSRKTGELRATTYNELDMEAVAAFDFDHEVR